MAETDFVKMKRPTPNPLDTDAITEIVVHKSTVESHEAAGWFVAEKNVAAPKPPPEPEPTKAEPAPKAEKK